MLHIILHHNSNKQGSLTIVNICVSTLAKSGHNYLKCAYVNQFVAFMDVLTSFLRYCQDIAANLFFWELWACLTIPI